MEIPHFDPAESDQTESQDLTHDSSHSNEDSNLETEGQNQQNTSFVDSASERDRDEKEKMAIGAISLSASPSGMQSSPLQGANKETEVSSVDQDHLERIYDTLDRLLVEDPNFQRNENMHQVLLRFKDNVLSQTEARISIDQGHLTVVVKSNSSESLKKLTPYNLNVLRERIASRNPNLNEVIVKVEENEQGGF